MVAGQAGCEGHGYVVSSVWQHYIAVSFNPTSTCAHHHNIMHESHITNGDEHALLICTADLYSEGRDYPAMECDFNMGQYPVSVTGVDVVVAQVGQVQGSGGVLLIRRQQAGRGIRVHLLYASVTSPCWKGTGDQTS